MAYDAFDPVEVRCPQLGGEVTFGYCRTLEEGLPCSKALVCFQYKFPVIEYFRRVLEDATFERVFQTPSLSRIEKFFTTLSKARERVNSSS